MRRALGALLVVVAAFDVPGVAMAVPTECARSNLTITSAGGDDLDFVHGVALDGAGNIFVALQGTIRRLDATGTQTLELPTAPTTPPIAFVYGIDVDPSGNVYAADPTRDVTYRFDPAGVQTLAIPSEGDNPAPSGVAADALGNIYVVDGNNKTVERFDATGVRTLQVHGTPAFNLPVGVAVDAAGNIYVADTAHNREAVYRFDAAGNQTLFLGPTDFAPPVNDGVGFGHSVSEVEVDAAGNIYVGVSHSGIFRFDATGTQTQFLPRTVTTPQLSIFTLALGPGGELYTADFITDQIDRIVVGPRPVPADVSAAIYLEALPETVEDGGTVTFLATFINSGPCAALGVEVVPDLPDGFDLVDAEPAPGTTYDELTNTWSLPTVEADRKYVQLRLTGTITGVGEATASVAMTVDPTLNTDVGGPDTSDATVDVTAGTTTTISTTTTSTVLPTTSTTSPEPPPAVDPSGVPARPVSAVPSFTG